MLLKSSMTSMLRLCGPIVGLLIMASCGTSNAPATSVAPTGASINPTSGTSAALTPATPAAATASAPSPQPAAQQVALTFAFPDDAANTRAAAELIQAYTASNPSVRVTAMPLPAKDYPKQLLDSLGAGAPDLFVGADAQAPALIKRNAVLDLHSLLAGGSSLKPGDFHPTVLAAWQRGNALYGLPTDVTPQVLFYNQDLFDSAGVAPPAPGWTWDDWVFAAKKLTIRSGGTVSRYGTTLTQWAAMVWSNGGELLSADGKQTLLDQPAAAEGVQFAADMINVHKVAPPPKDAGGADPVMLFQSQQAAMMPGASSLASVLLAAKLPFKWGIAPLPAAKTPVSPVSISGLFVSSQSQHQPAALDFAAWIAGPQGSALKAPIMPFAAPALQSAAPRSGQITGEEAILQALQHGRALPQLEVWPEIKALIDTALKPVWHGQTTAAAAYRSVTPKVNELLKVG
jgi:multiple sugar transport system substrate-binding protein